MTVLDLYDILVIICVNSLNKKRYTQRSLSLRAWRLVGSNILEWLCVNSISYWRSLILRTYLQPSLLVCKNSIYPLERSSSIGPWNSAFWDCDSISSKPLILWDRLDKYIYSRAWLTSIMNTNTVWSLGRLVACRLLYIRPCLSQTAANS